ncbi:MAG: hypothetical protein R2788_16060 [Saprospiraceae bacterium]
MPSGTYREVLKALEEYQVNIDGKVLRATREAWQKDSRHLYSKRLGIRALCIAGASEDGQKEQ